MLTEPEMYRLPGDPPFQKKDFERYENNRLSEDMDWKKVVLKGIRVGNRPEVMKGAVMAIACARESERAELVELALQSELWAVRETVGEIIHLIPEEKRAGLVNIAMNDRVYRVREVAIEAVADIPEGLRTSLIERGLKDDNPWVLSAAAQGIQYVQESERSRLIEMGLSDGREWVREVTVGIIPYAPESDRPRLIEIAMNDDSERVRANTATYISRKMTLELKQVKKKRERGRFKERIKRQLLKREIKRIQKQSDLFCSELYQITPERFFTHEFEKSGTRIKLLDIVPGLPEKTLKEKLIIRNIPVNAFMEWRKAYEAIEVWKKRGFSYVPVEPIVKANIKADLSVNVATRVVPGPSLGKWLARTKMYKQELIKEYRKIRKALSEIGVVHGHLHNGNIVLAFQKDEKGQPDLTEVPRLYVIDFDEAYSNGE